MNHNAPIAIIAAMAPELEYLQQALANAQTQTFFGQKFYQGDLAGRKVVLALSGIGKVNAALTTATLLNQFQPQAVINTGSAGGLGKAVHIGDVVLGKAAAHHDVDVTAFGYQHGQVPQLPLLFTADAVLLQAARQAAQTFATVVHEGLIVSGDQFVHGAEQVARIRAHFPEVAACEMEAAAIAQVCHQAAVPFVVIRAISDHADEQAEKSFDEFIVLAGAQSAKMVQMMLPLLPHTFA